MLPSGRRPADLLIVNQFKRPSLGHPPCWQQGRAVAVGNCCGRLPANCNAFKHTLRDGIASVRAAASNQAVLQRSDGSFGVCIFCLGGFSRSHGARESNERQHTLFPSLTLRASPVQGSPTRERGKVVNSEARFIPRSEPGNEDFDPSTSCTPIFCLRGDCSCYPRRFS